ncbi:MAG: HD-GYP domain-containing protein, partial [Kangiellaceae bacterium]|nr:HD-GYP domain-containing protein [Kangiellaceae bacterium]
MTGQFTYLKKVKVASENLQIGMYVSELDKNWSESSFLFQGFPLNNLEEVKAVQAECDWVYIEFTSQEDYQIYLTTVAKSEDCRVYSSAKNDLNYELPRANNHFQSSTKMVKNVMQNILKDEDFDLAPVQQAVEDCMKSILSNQDALLLLTNIKNADEYTAEHCLRVAIMSIAFGRYLGYKEDELRCMGIGAMLHDVGKMKIPDSILNKPGRLSPAEFNIMQDHTIEGYKILKDKGALSSIAIDIAHSHHEKLNGEGYPRNLIDSSISEYTKIVTIVDSYDAITSERVYSSAKSPAAAFKILREHSGSQFDGDIVNKFIEWMGIYPVGSLIEMQTGEL